MAQKKHINPYFKTILSQSSSPTPKPISTTNSAIISPRNSRKKYLKPAVMVNFAKLDTKALIEAAIVPSTSQPEHNPRQLKPHALGEPEAFATSSRKRTRLSNEGKFKRTRVSKNVHSSDESLVSSDSSEEDTLVTKPKRKKPRQRIVDDDDDEEEEDYDVPPRQHYNKAKGRTSVTRQINNRGNSEEDDAGIESNKATTSKSTSVSRKSSSFHKASTVTKPRKSIGTPVPATFEEAHPADKELLKMKADGKPWKEIKPVWEKLMGKSTGDSTLSVRYCKMKENFEKAGGKDDIRILKFKAQVEAELEADKWERVAEMTEKDGGKAMTAREVKLRFKEIERNGIQADEANNDTEVPEVTFADMDAIDRELAGVGDVDDTGDLSGSEQSNVDESMGLPREGERMYSATRELTLEEQRLIESFEVGNGPG